VVDAVSFPRFPARRGGVRAATWWGKAWVRAVEESALDDRALKRGRSMSRSGRVGPVTVGGGTAVAAVEDPGGALHSARVDVATLDDLTWATFVDELAARSGHTAALLAGDLPHALMEDAEAAGVELLPYGGELESGCDCGAWQPCLHAVALMYQLGWLLDDDPFLLFWLRGRSRQELLVALNRRIEATESGDLDAGADRAQRGDDPADDLLADASQRARRILELAEAAPTGEGLADVAVARFDLLVAGLVDPDLGP
jgi:uncharacterized Zn finger protein